MTEPSAVVRLIFERAWNEGDFEGLPEVLADQVVYHFRRSSRDMDLLALEGVIVLWRQAFPDLRFTIEDLTSEGDLVSARLTYGGTHLGTWKGVPATGKSFEADGMFFFRFEDGRLVEVWEVSDELGMWRQLGVVPG